MPTYAYVGVDKDGKHLKGKISAANDLDLEDRVGDLGLDIISYKALKRTKPSMFSSVKVKDLIVFCVHLEQLDRAGVPILDSISDLRDSSDTPLLRDLMADIYENVKGGDLLSEALAKRPDVFSEVFVGLISAGERTGNLSESFAHIAHHLKWSNDLRRKIKKATMYPIFLLILMVGVISLMMLFVVPQLSEFLLEQGFELPVHTTALIWTSKFFVKYWTYVLGLPVMIIMTILTLHRTSMPARYKIDAVLLWSPFLGPVILKTNLARFCHFFAVTFKSGIGILDCLKTSEKVTSNEVIKESIRDITQNVSDGSSITGAISATNRFPSLVIRMFKVGEDSGDMDSALKNVNFFYDREINDSVDAMIGVMQPALTIVMGALMFWVTAAVFGPLYDSFSKMQF